MVDRIQVICTFTDFFIVSSGFIIVEVYASRILLFGTEAFTAVMFLVS